jgi:hypothetical protein
VLLTVQLIVLPRFDPIVLRCATVGAGKSIVTKEIVWQLRAKGRHSMCRRIQQCAGLRVEYVSYQWATSAHAGESCRTLHSLMGVGLMDKPLDVYLKGRMHIVLHKNLVDNRPIDVSDQPKPLLDACGYRRSHSKRSNFIQPLYSTNPRKSVVR